MKSLVFVALLLSANCARVESNVRLERGPLLRTFERPVVLEGGLKGEVQLTGSQLQLAVVGYDVCRTQKVEEYAEIKTTERRQASAGPALSTGIANILASAVLFGVSFAVSGSADTSIIDAGGRYGPSTKQYLQGASAVTLGIGLPALVVGLIVRAGTSDEVETRRAEQVTSQVDSPCQDRRMSGPLTLVASTGASVLMQMSEGGLLVDAITMPIVPETIRFADRPVELTEEGRALFARWAERIASVPNSPRAERAASGEERESVPKEVDSLEEALATYAPKFKVAPDSSDLGMLDGPTCSEGCALSFLGIVVESPEPHLTLLQVGTRHVFLKTEAQSFSPGTRLEGVALREGLLTAREKTLPLLRAVWVQTAW